MCNHCNSKHGYIARYFEVRKVMFFILIMLCSCSSVYYSALEKIGYQKRSLLKDRIVATQSVQQKTADDFRTALERFREVVPGTPSELETRYKRLSETVAKLESRKNEVSTRISKVESVADALFDEWHGELNKYSNETLKSKSEQTLKATERRYEEVRQALRDAYDRIQPALSPLQDQVLFLKHNLNASTVSSLEAERQQISAEINVLLREIEEATKKSERFIAEL